MTVPDRQRVTANMVRKGRRLHRDGKVRFVRDARVYVVEGDHANYLVVVCGDSVTCDCPHHGTCSHVQAVRIARRDNEASARTLAVTALEIRPNPPT